MLYLKHRMADPKDPHTLADHKLGTGLGHVHDGDADHDHDDLFDGPLDNVEPAQLLSAFAVGVDSFRARQRPEKLVEVGIAQAKKRSTNDEATALKLLDLIAQVVPFGNTGAPVVTAVTDAVSVAAVIFAVVVAVVLAST